MKIVASLLLCLCAAAAAVAQQSEPAKPATAGSPETKPAETKAVAAKPAAAAAAAAPTAEQLVDKYIEARGGRAAIEKVTSVSARGAFELPAMNINGTAEMYSKAPNKRYLSVNIPGFGEVKQGFDGTTGWNQDPNTGKFNEAGGNELARQKADGDLYRDLKLKETYKMSLKGREKVGEREVYIVEATAPFGAKKLYFDTQTGLLVRLDSERAEGDNKFTVEEYYEDYRDVEGLKFPFTYRQSNPQYSYSIKFSEVKFNTAVEDAKFTKPTQ